MSDQLCSHFGLKLHSIKKSPVTVYYVDNFDAKMYEMDPPMTDKVNVFEAISVPIHSSY